MNQINTQKIAEVVNSMHLPSGLGTHQSACSIAAINLALTGELTDSIPDCMSKVIGQWIIVTQDSMPDEMRNSVEWKSLLPLAAGTGRAHEKKRLDLLMEHMWEVALPMIQPIADAGGYGAQWHDMVEKRTLAAAEKAARASARAVRQTARAAARALGSASAQVSWSAARAAGWAARAAARAARAATDAEEARAWQTLNPCALLRQLIDIGAEQ
jgi:hypothetical protein